MPATAFRREPVRWLGLTVALSAWWLFVHAPAVSVSTTLAPPAAPGRTDQLPYLRASLRPPGATRQLPHLRASPRPSGVAVQLPHLRTSLRTQPPDAFTASRRVAARPAAVAPQRTLTWPQVPGAVFYDVVLSRGGVRVLDLWPTTAHVRLPAHWTFHGRHFTLADGSYSWFVYPASGTHSTARFGALVARGAVGKST